MNSKEEHDLEVAARAYYEGTATREQRRLYEKHRAKAMAEAEKAHPPWSREQYEAKRAEVEANYKAQGGFKNRMNIYKCDTCQGFVLSKDVDHGTTPMFMGCKQWCNPACDGRLTSYMYRIPPVMIAREGIQFYYPTYEEYSQFDLTRRDHVETFGLVPRRAEWIDKNSKDFN